MTAPRTLRVARRARARRPALAVGVVGFVVAILAGCGSRVPLSEREGNASLGGAQGGNGTASLQAQGGGNGAAGPNGAIGGAGAAGGIGGAPGSGSTAGGAIGSGGGSAAAAAGSTALGVSATTISIGYPYSTTAPLAAFSAACSACSSFGNETYFPQFFDTLAADLNAKGGILKHKVVFKGYAYNSTAPASDSSSAAQFEQAACNNFSHDTPVFAVLFISLDPEVLAPCLSKNHVSLIAPYDWEDGKDLNKLLLYAPGAGVDYPFMKVFLQRLKAQSYFGGWNTTTGGPGTTTKIGVVNFNDPGWVGQGTALLQAMKDLGIKVDPQDILTYSAELDTQSQNVQNAVLKFRADGVTHVLGSAANGLWMYEAVGQNYFPRYGWYVGFGNDMNARSQQGLVGAMGVGEAPVQDIDAAQNPPSVGPQQKRCEAIATKAGVGWQSNQGMHSETLEMCDAVWSMAAALEKSGTLTPAGLAQGYDSLGSFPSTFNFQETWGPGRHASNSMVEDIRYDTGCSCFKYAGVKTTY
jgi:hypothetical protein